jgi:hypothetical protein
VLSALALAAFLLPGLCWWVWLGDRDKDPLEALAGILGVSVALTALGALFFYTVRLSVSAGLLGALLGLTLSLTGYGVYRRRKEGVSPWGWLLALAVFGALCVWRLWQARGLALPAWVDSLHHSLIIRKMIEAGGLSSTLEPYLPGPFYYHYAVHSAAALVSALSGDAPAQTLLWLGQIFTAGVSLSAYSLVKASTRDWRPAALAGLLVTFATKMPGYYLSWGRYTLLTGMLMLPLAMAEALRVARGERLRRSAPLLVVLTAGTLLSHYLAAFLLALFLIVLALAQLGRNIRPKNRDWRPLLALTASALAGLALVSRWYWRVFRYSRGMMSTEIQLPASGALSAEHWDYFWNLVGPLTGYVVLGLACARLVWAFTRPKTRPLALWSLLVGLLSLPFGLVLGPFRSDHFALALFLPAACLAACLLVWAGDWLRSRHPRQVWGTAALLLVCAALLGGGAWLNREPVNASTVLADESDLKALEWIEDHLPSDARFFINTTGWGYGLYRGMDGGAWVLPYTGRWSLAPTIFYTFSGEEQSYGAWIDWSQRANGVNGCTQEFKALMAEAGLNYLYLREGVGSLQALGLRGCPEARQLYSAGGVSIWLWDDASIDAGQGE